MPPPPVTPSPHRFVTKPKKTPLGNPQVAPFTERVTPAKPDTQPKSTPWQTKKQLPRYAATPVAQDEKSSTNAAQFAATPRFSFARPPSPKRQRIDEPEHFATPRRFVSGKETRDPVLPDNDHDEEADEADETPQHTRHISLPPGVAPDSDDPIPLHNSRPVFLHRPQEPQEAVSPLPEAFSPHRKGQKFVPGGMASEVRQWILDTTHVPSRRPGEMWRVHVMECKGSAEEGCVLARGGFEGREVRLLLPAGGGAKDVEVDQTVGIKGPTWEIELEGVEWVVAADWSVVQELG